MKRFRIILITLLFFLIIGAQHVSAQNDSTWFTIFALHSYNVYNDMADDYNLFNHVKFQSIGLEYHRSWYGASVWYGLPRNSYLDISQPEDISKSEIAIPEAVNGFAFGLNALVDVVLINWFRLQVEPGIQYFNAHFLNCERILDSRRVDEDIYIIYADIPYNSVGFNFKVSTDFRIYKGINFGLVFQYIDHFKRGLNGFINVGFQLKYDLN